MLRAALRSLLQHKLRLVLTLVAVVAGVAFVAGTYIFTDSLKQSFDALFSAPQPDVIVSAQSAFGSGPGQGGAGGGQAAGDVTPTMPESDLATVKAVSGVQTAVGVVAADGALVIGADGKVVGANGPPARGTTTPGTPAFKAPPPIMSDLSSRQCDFPFDYTAALSE